MIISVWSPKKGVSKTTTTALEICLRLTSELSKEVALFTTEYKKNDLMDCVIRSQIASNRIKTYDDSGIDLLIKNAKVNNTTKSVLLQGSNDPGEIGLALYGATKNNSRELYEKELNNSFDNIVELLDDIFDYTFVDLEAGDSSLSVKALGRANLVIVCLPPNKRDVDNFFSYYKDKARFKKCIFVLTGVDPKSNYNINNLRKDHKSLVNYKNSVELPYCIDISNEINNNSLKALMYKYSKVNDAPNKDLSNLLKGVDAIVSLITSFKKGGRENVN